jgi:polysaccharide deacetylase 2 family uncharacterized protein YibQ
MKKQRLTHYLLLLTCAFWGFMPQAQAKPRPVITLIIDDLGYSKRNGIRAINLPGPVTLAILPHTPHSTRLAKLAYAKGKTVMLHTPMTNVLQKSPGPGTLSPQMSKADFMREFRKSLDSMPHIEGVNNHMGSELTQNSTRMQWIMEEVFKRRLFFVDSRTTAKSVAAKEASNAGVPTLSRDIFLDHIRTEEAVNEAFDTMVRKAKHYGNMIAIGHPYTVTMNVLEKRLPELKKQGIDLVSVSSLLLAKGQSYDKGTQLADQKAETTVNLPAAAPRINQPAALLLDKAIAKQEKRSAARSLDKAAATQERRAAALRPIDEEVVVISPNRSKDKRIASAENTKNSSQPKHKNLIFQNVKKPAVQSLPPVQSWAIPVREH